MMWNTMILGVGQWDPRMGAIIGLVVVWSLVWKGLALWKSAREASKPWFVILLIVNTVGILDILYLYVFSKRNKKATGSTPV